MIECHGRVETLLAATYLERLCKHFAKKIPATWEGMRGTADFPFGQCTMEATADALLFRCMSPDTAAMEQLQEVIAVHIGMFTKRNPLKVDWK